MPAPNKRFGTRRGVCPQKVLPNFQAFTPARIFVFPSPAPSRRPLATIRESDTTKVLDIEDEYEFMDKELV